jgi:hypothetical protein
VGVDGLRVSTATYFVPSVSCAFRGRSHNVLCGGDGLAKDQVLPAVHGQPAPGYLPRAGPGTYVGAFA